MERTMLESFCAAANFRAFLKRLDLPSSVRDVADAIELPRDVRATFLQSSRLDFGKSTLIKISQDEKARQKTSKLDRDVVEALQKVSASISAFTSHKWSPPLEAVKHGQVVLEGKSFSTEKTTNSMGLICIRNGRTYVPGKLRDIISISYPDAEDSCLLNVLYLFIVHQHLPASSKISNPFLKYRDFGANLWSSDCYKRPSVVPVFPDTRFCHGILRKWDANHIVVKPLDRVSLLDFFRCPFLISCRTLTKPFTLSVELSLLYTIQMFI